MQYVGDKGKIQDQAFFVLKLILINMLLSNLLIRYSGIQSTENPLKESARDFGPLKIQKSFPSHSRMLPGEEPKEL